MLLSVVATSRNDDHGGNALWRTQHFVDGLAHQAKKHQVPIELVLVDWNPLPDRVGLFEALKWPAADEYFQYRVIVVPSGYHQQFKHAKELPLFQYLAKNVGIRRAQGDFILATNIDILFSDQLFQFFKSGLKKGCLYRVDRFDMDDKIPEGVSFEEILSYAEKNILRVNSAIGTLSLSTYQSYYKSFKLFLFWKIVRLSLSILKRIIFASIRYLYRGLSYVMRCFLIPFKGMPKRSITKELQILTKVFTAKCMKFYHFVKIQYTFFLPKVIHTNACGDFTLMSKDDWHALKAYPEWEIYSWHIDSVLLYQAYYSHIQMCNLNYKHPIYHIEHGKGSGFTPEYANLLFQRLDDKEIGYLTDKDLEKIIFDQYQQSHNKVTISYNDDSWGGLGEIFPENTLIVDLKRASA